MLFPKPYVRKPFEITAEQVTAANMNEVAAWAGGEVKILERGNTPYIEIVVKSPHQPDRVAMANVTDWVTVRGGTMRVFSDAAFKANFDLAALYTNS